MLKFFVILLLVEVISSQTPVKSCGNGQLIPRAVYFGGKENFCSKPPCVLKRGKIATSEVEFVSPFNSKTIMPKARARVFGLPIDLELGIKAASTCKLLNKGCPISKGGLTTFKLEKPVELNATPGTADVEYSLVGDNSKTIFCYKLKTTIV